MASLIVPGLYFPALAVVLLVAELIVLAILDRRTYTPRMATLVRVTQAAVALATLWLLVEIALWAATLYLRLGALIRG